MDHIMLDIETLDTAPSAVVIGIGAVAFDARGNELGEQFYVELSDDIAAQQARGRTISGDTVRWWAQQDEAARQIFAPASPTTAYRVSTVLALVKFTDFVNRNGGQSACVWGNGIDFDNVILGSLYESFEMPQPWSYGKGRCYRTAKNLGIGPHKPNVRAGVHHNALDDAITQAVHLQEILACLK